MFGRILDLAACSHVCTSKKKYTWAIDESLPHKDTRITIQLKHQHKVLQKKLLAFTEKSNYFETTES